MPKIYLLNQASTQSLKGITPQEGWSGRTPYVSHSEFVAAFVIHVCQMRKDASLLINPKSVLFLIMVKALTPANYKIIYLRRLL